MINIKLFIIACLVFLGLGFYVGRQSIDVKTKIKYIRGKTLRDSIPYDKLVPIYIKSPSLKTYIERTDSIRVFYTTSPKDTAQSLKNVLEDWNLSRTYDRILFNDSINGIFHYNATVQFNKISSFKYDYTPITRVETRSVTKTIEPFLSAEYSTLNTVSVGGGFFYNKLGLELKYQKDFINGNNGISFGVKFKP